MAWAKREAVTNLVILGDEEGHKKTVGGLLIGCPHDRMYPDKVNYEIVRKDGEVIVLSGSASLNRQINEQDVGKFIKCEFKGWGRSANGKFKEIEVLVWEGEVDAGMKSWPRYAEFQTPTQAEKRQSASNGASHGTSAAKAPVAAPIAAPADDFDDFSGPADDDDNSLPF